MKSRFLFFLVCFALLHLRAALPSEYQSLKSDAEKLFDEGSFAKANEIYRQITLTHLPSGEQRWVEFRRADTQWRSAASTENADTTKLDEARSDLEKQIRDLTREDQHDRVWAEVEESLGDFFWTRRNHQNWGEAWPHYQAALDWWAGQSDLNPARARYLAIVWRMAKPPQVQPYYSYGSWGNYVPLDILENALKISQTENDKAHAHYLIAMTIQNRGGGANQFARVPEEFEGAIQAGKTTDWYDDALYNYAEWMTGRGRVIPLENGSWRSEPDYPKALELFRRLVSEFKKGETRYWEQAQQQIKNITDPQLGVSVANIFLPDSEIQYQLNWRNVKHIELALYPVELNRDVQFPAEDENRKEWLQTIDLSGREKIKSWSYDPHPQPLSRPSDTLSPARSGGEEEGEIHTTSSKANYQPGNDTLHLDEKLKPGAYVLEAQGGGKSAREIVLVTDAALVLKASGKQALVYFCNALDSSPILKAKIKLWQSWWDDDRKWHWREYEKTADTNGIAVFQLEQHAGRNAELFASAISTNRQAFSDGQSYQTFQNFSGITADLALRWRLYAFTDRPAYRPKETAHWKFIARRYDDSIYTTPANQKIQFEITDPRGAKIKSETITLNSFGSAWGDLELTEKMPLGEYRVTFWDETHKYTIGNATLFRLEEYKLPEFKVTVQTPEENGRKKIFRLGDEVEA
ncbi:MAG TPA: MG2 domain-containing protein, partial [Verrucomicrobiae bacterium]|nr:MG2 domain-containing protein [Verrucomicrobiae bacterium]